MDTNDESVLERLQGSKTPIVLFGAGFIGGLFLQATKKNGIRVDAFCDNFCCKDVYQGLPVMKPSAAAARYRNAKFVICFINVPSITRQLRALGIEEAYGVGLLQREPTAKAGPGFSDTIRQRQAIRRCVSLHRGIAEYPEKISSGYEIELDITSRCTLRCENCGNFMQYYRHPENRDTGEILKGIDALCECFDDIVSLNILGGEPLLHPDFHRIAAYAAEKEIVRHVGIVTNGTLCPAPEQWCLLAHPKINIKISDYGHLSRNRERLIEEASKWGVSGHIINADDWKELRLLPKQGRNEEELRQQCRDCGEGVVCLTYMNRKLYRCEQAANGTNLGAMPDDPADYVDLRPVIDKVKGAEKHVRRKLGHFIYENELTPACDYCLGLSRNNKKVEKAVQCAAIVEIPERAG